MSAIVSALLAFFGQGVGQKIGQGVANGISIAALAPVALWFLDNKDGVAVSLTYGELALFGAFAFALVKVVQYTAPRRAEALQDWRDR